MSEITKTIALVAALVVLLNVLSGSAGFANVRLGTSGDDTVEGTGGPNLLVGLEGHDELLGQGEWDAIFGGSGSDLLYGGPGVDMIYGGAGDDQVYVWDDHVRDLVDCGSGSDTVYISGPDQALGSIDSRTCEIIQTVPFDGEAPEAR